MGFSTQECWSGLPFPSPGDLPKPGIEPGSPTLQADALPSEPQGKPASQRKSMPKNAQTTTQLHSSHTLVMLKILQARLQQYMNHELPDVQADLEKAEEPDIKLPAFAASSKKRVPEKHLLLLY